MNTLANSNQALSIKVLGCFESVDNRIKDITAKINCNEELAINDWTLIRMICAGKKGQITSEMIDLLVAVTDKFNNAKDLPLYFSETVKFAAKTTNIIGHVVYNASDVVMDMFEDHFGHPYDAQNPKHEKIWAKTQLTSILVTENIPEKYIRLAVEALCGKEIASEMI